MDCGCRVLSFLCLYFQFDGERVMQFLVSVYTSASNVFKPIFNFYMYILTINVFIPFTYLLLLLLFVVIMCYLNFSPNFYCHGISVFYQYLSTWIYLLRFVFLNLSTWICFGSKCLLYNTYVYSGSKRLRIPTVEVGRMQGF